MENKELYCILSSLNDSHFRKRIEEFIEHGYSVKVFGFKREGQSLPDNLPYKPIVLGEIANRNFKARLSLFNSSIKKIANECRGKLCFYSSLDIAMFARIYIRSSYIYEVCDLTELTINNPILRGVLTKVNESTIVHSLITIVTSEGFVEYFKGINREKFHLIANKVSPHTPNFRMPERSICREKIKIGFVGQIRFETIFRFIKVSCEFSNIEIHLYGFYNMEDSWAVRSKQLQEEHSNIFFHGKFQNPEDLPSIYQDIDLLLCTYPPTLGVKYAEANKIYEAIYFRCPIIATQGVFLGDKVARLNIGYAIDSTNEDAIRGFLEALNEGEYKEKVTGCLAIPQEDCLNINDDFFQKLETIC